VERVSLPTARVAQLATGVVEHAVAIELVVGVELALVSSAIAEGVLSVGLAVEIVSVEGCGRVGGWLGLGRWVRLMLE
jgi:hypothetical protein